MQRSAAIVAGILVVLVVAVAALVLLRPTQPSASQPSQPPQPDASAAASAPASAGASVDPELLDRRWTVLFVGIDVNEARAGDPGFVPNADGIMLVSLSADASELTLVSLPRDTVDVPLPDGTTYPQKINAMYSDLGLDAMVGALETLTEVPIDGYAALDMDDFTALVDAVGGVEVAPEEPLTDPIVNLELDAGPQEIDAETANGYVRTRVDQDYGRMGRQQEVLLAILERLVDPETDVDVRALVDSLESLETDLPLDDLPTLLELGRRAADAEATRILIEPPLITFEGDRGDGRGYVLEADADAIRERLADAIGE